MRTPRADPYPQMFKPQRSSYKRNEPWVQYAESEHGPIAYRTVAPGGLERFVVLFSHGNACDIGNRSVTEPLGIISESLGAVVFGFDYCGYGRSPKDDTSVVCTEVSALAVYRVAATKARELGVPLLLIGHSLGAAVMISLAVRTLEAPIAPAALVVLCPFVSPMGVLWGPLKALRVLDYFNNSGALKKCGEHDLPVFFAGSTADEVISFGDAKQLYEDYSGAHKMLYDARTATHMTILNAKYLEPILAKLREWLDVRHGHDTGLRQHGAAGPCAKPAEAMSEQEQLALEDLMRMINSSSSST